MITALIPSLLLGISFPKNPAHNPVIDLSNFESVVGVKHDLSQIFTPFDSRTSPEMVVPYFYTKPMDIWKSGKIPVLTWYPATSTVYPTPTNINVLIYSGQFDSYLDRAFSSINKFLGDAKVSSVIGSPKIYIRYAHEMNIGSHLWSGPTPSDYVKAWQYVVNYSRKYPNISKNTVQFIWCPNNNDIGTLPVAGNETTGSGTPTPPFENYYPGDEFVDWVGVDGYAWRGRGEQQSFEQVMVPALNRLRNLTSKPIMIAEYGVAPKNQFGYDVDGKAAWVKDAFNWISSNAALYNIKASMYYNISMGGGDIDSAIFIPSNLVVDTKSLNTTVSTPDNNNYFSFTNVRSVYSTNLGYENNNKVITLDAFQGK
jgi:hypothetical protein